MEPTTITINGTPESPAAAPIQEPQRQQYYMEKARKQLSAFSTALGRPLTC